MLASLLVISLLYGIVHAMNSIAEQPWGYMYGNAQSLVQMVAYSLRRMFQLLVSIVWTFIRMQLYVKDEIFPAYKGLLIRVGDIMDYMTDDLPGDFAHIANATINVMDMIDSEPTYSAGYEALLQ